MKPVLVKIAVVMLTGLFFLSPLKAREDGIPHLSWRFVTGGKILAKPALDHRGIVYIASADRNLYAVLPTGEKKWSFRIEGKPSGSPVVGYDGTIYIGSESGRFFAVAPNGLLRWSFSADTGYCLSPALGSDGTIYLPTSGGTVYALSFAGRLRWQYRLKAEISSSLSIGPEGTIYIGSSDRLLHAFSPSGEKKWEVELSGRAGTPAIGADGTLYINSFGIQAVSPEGIVLWTYSIPAQTASPVLGSDGTIIAGARNGRLYAISPQGEKLWDLYLGEEILSAAAVAGDGTIFVGTKGSRLYAVSLRGKLKWSFSAREKVNIPALGLKGVLYFGSDDWILYALNVGLDFSFVSSWPLYLHDTHHTGRFTGLKDLNSPAALILKEMAYSDSIELKSTALEDIEKYLAGADFLAIHAQTLEEILGYLASEGVTHRAYRYRELVNDYPPLRIEACRILGSLATEGSKVILLEVIRRDQDVLVKSTALEALGRIGTDPDGEMVRTIVYELEKNVRAEQYVLAALAALGRIVEHDGRFSDPSVYPVLVRLTLSRYSNRVKERALDILGIASKQERREK